MRCGQVMTPLYRLMCRRVLLGHSLHTDDTALVMLDPRRTAHAWVYVGDAAHPYTVFDLSVGHSHEFPQAFLKGYIGFIHADGFAGYDAIYQAGAIHAGCWAHARRYFFDARLVSPELAHEALARIRTLYAVEADAKALHHTGTELAAYRREHAGPVLDAFALWLAKRAPQVLPKSKIGEAFTYATNQWPSLGVYLTDGRLTIDNHPAEQAIRPLAVGRRYAQFGAMRSCDRFARSSRLDDPPQLRIIPSPPVQPVGYTVSLRSASRDGGRPSKRPSTRRFISTSASTDWRVVSRPPKLDLSGEAAVLAVTAGREVRSGPVGMRAGAEPPGDSRAEVPVDPDESSDR
jgi:hypothetical protein